MKTNCPILNRLIQFSALNPWFILIVMAVMAIGVWQAIQRAPLDAILICPSLRSLCCLMGWTSRTRRRSAQLSVVFCHACGTRGQVRACSIVLRFVIRVCDFEEGTDLYWARSQLRTTNGCPRLPAEANIKLGPDASGVGWVMMYALLDESGELGLGELRTLQDWRIQTALSSVSGVAEVAAFGGQVERYEITVNPAKLMTYDLSIVQLKKALTEANQSSGGGVIEQADHEYMIRGQVFRITLRLFKMCPFRSVQWAGIDVGMVAEVQVGPSGVRALPIGMALEKPLVE